ncbi:MAG: PilZ domain-containing protein [Candidatus Omnitrophota bacterium]
MNDRRQVPRWQIRKTASVAIDGSPGTARCCVEDINLKGMCLSLPQRLPQGRDIKMALNFDDDLVMDVAVTVPWVRELPGRYAHGLSFTRILDRDRENIYKYVNDRFPQLLREGWWHAGASPAGESG